MNDPQSTTPRVNSAGLSAAPNSPAVSEPVLHQINPSSLKGITPTEAMLTEELSQERALLEDVSRKCHEYEAVVFAAQKWKEADEAETAAWLEDNDTYSAALEKLEEASLQLYAALQELEKSR